MKKMLIANGLVGMDDGSLGTIEQGMLADIIVVDGNPLHDPGMFVGPDNIMLVMKDGQICRNRLSAKPGAEVSRLRDAVTA